MRPPTPRMQAARAGVQILGLLGTSHLLDVAWRLALPESAGGIVPPLDDGSAGRPWDGLAGLAVFAFLTPLVEELTFRGLVLGLLRRLGGASVALIGSALAFGLVHPGPLHAAAATLLGLQLGAMRLVHGLVLAIVAHMANNALALLLAPSAAAGEPAPSAAALALLALAALASGIAWADLVRSLRSGPAPSAAPTTSLQRVPEATE